MKIKAKKNKKTKCPRNELNLHSKVYNTEYYKNKELKYLKEKNTHYSKIFYNKKHIIYIRIKMYEKRCNEYKYII